MKINSSLNGLFKPEPVRATTPMDRTTAAAREIIDAAARDRAERTARLRATRLERQAHEELPAETPARTPAAKRKPSKG